MRQRGKLKGRGGLQRAADLRLAPNVPGDPVVWDDERGALGEGVRPLGRLPRHAQSPSSCVDST